MHLTSVELFTGVKDVPLGHRSTVLPWDTIKSFSTSQPLFLNMLALHHPGTMSSVLLSPCLVCKKHTNN